MSLPQWSTYSYSPLHPLRRHTIPWRHGIFITAGLLTTCYVIWRFLTPVPQAPHHSTPHVLPPLYSSYHEAEIQLPQHLWNRTTPRSDEKFFYVAGHSHGLGWNNALQELLFNAYLAYRAGRSHVFANYTWDEKMPYSKYQNHMIPSQIPFTALIRGPIVGDPWPAGDQAPLSVHWDYFDRLCPRKYEIDNHDVNGNLDEATSAAILTDRWSTRLKKIPYPCVQSPYDMGYVYGHDMTFGVHSSLADIWPDFSSSPIVTHFFYSSLVELAFDTNRDLFLPPSAASSQPLLTGLPLTTNADRYRMIPGLMVIHVRRGDYEVHCNYIEHVHEDFVSFATLPGLLDPFIVPQPRIMDEFLLPPSQRSQQRLKSNAETRELYRKRCWPTIPEMVAKVADVLQTPTARGINRIYIMTNAQEAFISALREALLQIADWEMIVSSRDVTLNWEQKFIAQAVDGLVAQRAQVFIGNGFSTLTSNAVLFRLANGFASDSTRFW